MMIRNVRFASNIHIPLKCLSSDTKCVHNAVDSLLLPNVVVASPPLLEGNKEAGGAASSGV